MYTDSTQRGTDAVRTILPKKRPRNDYRALGNKFIATESMHKAAAQTVLSLNSAKWFTHLYITPDALALTASWRWRKGQWEFFCRPELQKNLDTGIRGLMRGMATLPQGNQELLVVRDKVGRPPGEQVHGM